MTGLILLFFSLISGARLLDTDDERIHWSTHVGDAVFFVTIELYLVVDGNFYARTTFITRNIAGTLRFYRDLLGLQLVSYRHAH